MLIPSGTFNVHDTREDSVRNISSLFLRASR